MTALILGVLALGLAGPVPKLLTRWPGAHLTPGASLVLWQAIGLAAVMAAIGSGLAVMTALTWSHQPTWSRLLGLVVGVGLSGTVVARLLHKGWRLRRGLVRTRRRHLGQLEMVSQPFDEHRVRTRIVPHGHPVAYCLPSARGSRIVVTQGAISTLSSTELESVMAHERQHAVLRHDLVIEFFTALHQAFPRWCASRLALREVLLLVELHADRAACRVAPPTSLATALIALGESPAPPGALAVGGAGLVRRIEVLADQARRPIQVALLLSAAWALLVLPTLFVALPWLVSLP